LLGGDFAAVGLDVHLNVLRRGVDVDAGQLSVRAAVACGPSQSTGFLLGDGNRLGELDAGLAGLLVGLLGIRRKVRLESRGSEDNGRECGACQKTDASQQKEVVFHESCASRLRRRGDRC